MNDTTKAKIVEALSGSRIGAIVACALGVDIPAPKFTSKAIVTSDGFVQANFVDCEGISRHSAFVGSYDDLEENMRSVMGYLQTNIGLSAADSIELFDAVTVDWIVTDYRH